MHEHQLLSVLLLLLNAEGLPEGRADFYELGEGVALEFGSLGLLHLPAEEDDGVHFGATHRTRTARKRILRRRNAFKKWLDR